MGARPDVISLVLSGHLTLDSLNASLAPILPRIQETPEGTWVDLLVDALGMDGYDNDARARFVAFNAETRSRVRRVAILTQNVLWSMVISAMSLASRQKMQAFPNEVEALQWLGAAAEKR